MTSDERAIIRFCQERIIGGTTVPSDPILRVASLARNGMLTVSREELVASLLHMHCNRMGVLGATNVSYWTFYGTLTTGSSVAFISLND